MLNSSTPETKIDNPYIEQSNAGAFYQAHFEAFYSLFEVEDINGETHRGPCIQLLTDERCPLSYRVALQVRQDF